MKKMDAPTKKFNHTNMALSSKPPASKIVLNLLPAAQEAEHCSYDTQRAVENNSNVLDILTQCTPSRQEFKQSQRENTVGNPIQTRGNNLVCTKTMMTKHVMRNCDEAQADLTAMPTTCSDQGETPRFIKGKTKLNKGTLQNDDSVITTKAISTCLCWNKNIVHTHSNADLIVATNDNSIFPPSQTYLTGNNEKDVSVSVKMQTSYISTKEDLSPKEKKQIEDNRRKKTKSNEVNVLIPECAETARNASVHAAYQCSSTILQGNINGHSTYQNSTDTWEDRSHVHAEHQQYDESQLEGRLKSHSTKKKRKNVPSNKVSDKQLIYIRFPKILSSKFDIHEFIANKIDADISFEVEGIIEDQETIAVLEFNNRTKAVQAIDRLKRGNITSDTKLMCTLDIKEARRSTRGVLKHVEVDLKLQLEQIVQLARHELQKHDAKIADTEIRLNNIQSRLKSRVSLDIFELLSDERQALLDGMKELELQKVEYQAYLKSIQGQMEQMVKTKDFNNGMWEVRKSFGIECCRLVKALPMYARRKDIVNTVRNNQVSIVLGETGSGKSTQLTQYLFQTGFAANGQIACTQPRKIAATNLATYVATEMATCVGQLVGYQVGMRKKTTSATKIVYMTDHSLLNEYLADNLLSRFSCLIIDEAHERTIFTDLLLGMIKLCLRKRPDLKLIITSATINPDIFVRYFDKCPVLKVSGRTFPVEVVWQKEQTNEPFANYEQNAINKAIEIHTNDKEGDILVFMTSPIETERACRGFEQRMQNRKDFQCMQLHGQLQANEQQLVFEPTKKGKRKIIFATNCAETSVTVPNIKFIIDTGVAKEMRFDPKRNINSLEVTMINQSSAEQRKGRAGRTAPGICYRLYTEDNYGKMCQTSTPEILRVNLCQALLKIYELGVDPFCFSFVEAPNNESMKTAMEALCNIGAVYQSSITDLGKWLAKLPLPPSVGHLIWRGIQKDVTMEAITVAAACTSGGNIFFRGNSDTEKKKSDQCKTIFAHEGGDLLTVLNVYRQWKDQPESKKNKWCVDNSINAKTIRSIRDTINEILDILKKELDQNITYEWHNSSSADKSMQMVIFLCYSLNLCHYLGHTRAGYICLESFQHLQVHPSSAMATMAYNAEWIVFKQTISTSQDFAMTITPVPEVFLRSAIENGDVELDIQDAKKRRLIPILLAPLGQTVFRDFVGPCFSSLKLLDSQIFNKSDNQLVILEAEKETGMVKILSMGQGNGVPETVVSCAIKKSENKIQKWDVERLVSKAGDVRVVLGTGGQVKHVLMPQEFRSVIVKCSENIVKCTSKDDVEKHFEIYGEITDCVPLNRKNDTTTWGRLRFSTPDSAQKAIKPNENLHIWACADVQNDYKANKSMFKSKILLCRRRPKGFCCINLYNPVDVHTLLSYGVIEISEYLYTVEMSKKFQKQVLITNVTDSITEENVRNAVIQQLGYDKKHANQVVDVFIPRMTVDTMTENVDALRQKLNEAIMEIIPKEMFSLSLKTPNPKDYFYDGFVAFKNVDDCWEVCRWLNKKEIGYERLQMKMDLFTSVTILGFIYQAVKYEIDRLNEDWLKKCPESRVTVKELRSGRVVVDLHTDSVRALVSYQALIHSIIDGDLFVDSKQINFNLLFTSEARKYLQGLERKTGALIYIDNRNVCLKLYGSEESRQNANAGIQKYLDKLENKTSKVINLTAKAGMLKALISMFGVDLADLRMRTKIESTEINYRRHTLKITGSNDSIESCSKIVEHLESPISFDTDQSNDPVPVCEVCFGQIQNGNLYRLDCCGHPYCQECARRQLKTAVVGRTFPVMCCSEHCKEEWFWSDIMYFIRSGDTTLDEVTENSISAFVRENKDIFSYCITADCPSIYRRSLDGSKFECKECGACICTTCNVQNHDGMTCVMYELVKKDVDLQTWHKKDPKNRKICPKCTTGIEKTGGCSMMVCAACRGSICWVCLAYFTSNEECYDHLNREHGGYNAY